MYGYLKWLLQVQCGRLRARQIIGSVVRSGGHRGCRRYKYLYIWIAMYMSLTDGRFFNRYRWYYAWHTCSRYGDDTPGAGLSTWYSMRNESKFVCFAFPEIVIHRSPYWHKVRKRTLAGLTFRRRAIAYIYSGRWLDRTFDHSWSTLSTTPALAVCFLMILLYSSSGYAYPCSWFRLNLPREYY